MISQRFSCSELMNCCVPAGLLRLAPTARRHPRSSSEERQHAGHRHRGRSQHTPTSATDSHHSGEQKGASWRRCFPRRRSLLASTRCGEEETTRENRDNERIEAPHTPPAGLPSPRRPAGGVQVSCQAGSPPAPPAWSFCRSQTLLLLTCRRPGLCVFDRKEGRLIGAAG